ncbi:hypothetical protein PMAYCL1PPCAC_24924, partial [Pristionchus mayeri]
PVFNAMFFGNFTEKNKKEIELKNVDREDFHVILKILCNPKYEIEDDMGLLESLLVLGDRYDIRAIIDRLEEILCKSENFSPAEKLLFADKHNSFRFIKLNMNVFEALENEDSAWETPRRDFLRSKEYLQLSPDTKLVCKEFMKNCIPENAIPEEHRLEDGRVEMEEGEHLMERIDENDLIATGCFRTLFEFEANQNFEGILSCSGHNSTEANWIGGLLWVVDARCDIHPHADGKERYLLSFMLVVNDDRPSIFDWKAEGIMEIEPIFHAKGICLMDESDVTYSTMSLDKDRKRINYDSANPYPIKKQFTFALDNNNRKGLTSCVCVIMNEQRNNWNYPGICLKTRIHLTKVTGRGARSHCDFTTLLPMSDVTLIVEEKEIHVGKQYLSSISTVFRTMFDENSSDVPNRIVLNGVKYQDCIEFLRWIYPSHVKNLEEDALSRVAALAKRFNVIFVIDQIARFLRCSADEYAYSLKMVLHFGYAVDLQFLESLQDNVYEYTDWKSISKQIENTAAYKEMEDEKAREMLEWMIKNWSTAESS